MMHQHQHTHTCIRQVDAVVAKARVASDVWKQSSFEQRRHALRTILKFVLENQAQMAQVKRRGKFGM